MTGVFMTNLLGQTPRHEPDRTFHCAWAGACCGIAVRDFSRARPEADGAVLRRIDEIVSAQAEHAGGDRTRPGDVDLVGPRAAGDRSTGDETVAARPAVADVRTRDCLSPSHAVSFRGASDQSRL